MEVPKSDAAVLAPRPPAPSPRAWADTLGDLIDHALHALQRASAPRPAAESAGPDPVADARDSVTRAAEWLTRWTGHPDTSGPATPPPSEAPTLGHTLDRAVSVYGPRAAAAGVRLSTQVDPQIVDRPAGPAYTVLANALINAIDAAADPRSAATDRVVRAELTAQGRGIALNVHDTGPGLDPQILDPDGRPRPGASTKPGGPGVGLGVCRQIAHDLGGTLRLANAPDGGAVFTLHHPGAAAA